LFDHLQKEDLKWDCITFASVVGVCTNLMALEVGKQRHGDIVTTQSGCNVFVETALLDMYAKCGIAYDLGRMFNLMLVHNVVSWTMMILEYDQQDNVEESISSVRCHSPLFLVLVECSPLKGEMELYGQVMKKWISFAS